MEQRNQRATQEKAREEAQGDRAWSGVVNPITLGERPTLSHGPASAGTGGKTGSGAAVPITLGESLALRHSPPSEKMEPVERRPGPSTKCVCEQRSKVKTKKEKEDKKSERGAPLRGGRKQKSQY